MERFAFIIHPLKPKQAARKYPVARLLPDFLLEKLLHKQHSKVVSHITGVKSATGAEAEGWFVGCPLTPKAIMTMPEEFTVGKIIESARIAQEQGAGLGGLGAYTSIAGDAGITVAKNVDIAVTTGNSYTVATAVEGLLRAAELMRHKPSESLCAIIGATGSIGRACAILRADSVAGLRLVGRDSARTERVAAEAREACPDCPIEVTSDIEASLKDAPLVVTVTSAIESVIQPAWLAKGAVICDVARPRDVSVAVAKERQDVLVIEGGVVSVPGEVEFGMDFGFPPRTAYACMSETMILALEGRYESFSLGRDIEPDKVKEIAGLAAKHGFKLAGFRSFERAVTPDLIESAQRAAGLL